MNELLLNEIDVDEVIGGVETVMTGYDALWSRWRDWGSNYGQGTRNSQRMRMTPPIRITPVQW